MQPSVQCKAILAAILLLFVLINASSAERDRSLNGNAGTPPAVASVAFGDLYAVVVGVSRYENSRVPALKFSVRDAKDFAEFLKSQKKLFRNIHLTLLTDEQATDKEVKKHLWYRLRKAGRNDTVILFFSGHGSDDPNIPGAFFFLTYEADPDYLQATAINMTGLEFLQRLDTQRVVLIADTCHAGGFSVQGSRNVRGALNEFVEKFKDSEGRVILTSARADQISLEKSDIGNGVFTYYLIKGLKGEADGNKDGVVSLREAYEYVYEKTKNETKGIQHPQLEGRVVGVFPMSFVGPTGTKLELVTDPPQVDISLREKSRFRFVKRSDVQGRVVLKDMPLGDAIIVKLSKPGWKDVILDPIFFSDHRLHVKRDPVKLKKALAFLVLRTNCPKASVKLNGKPMGKTGDDGMIIMDSIQVAVPLEVSFASKDFMEKSVTLSIPNSHEGKVYKAPSIHLRRKKELVARAKPPTPPRETKVVPSVKEKKKKEDSGPAMKKKQERLLQAARTGDLKVVKELLDQKVAPDARDQLGWTALMYACTRNHVGVAKLLLARGAEVNARDKLGWSPLMVAASNGHESTVKLLLAKGADQKAKNIYGETAAIKASIGGHRQVLRLLGEPVEPPRPPREKAASRPERRKSSVPRESYESSPDQDISGQESTGDWVWKPDADSGMARDPMADYYGEAP